MTGSDLTPELLRSYAPDPAPYRPDRMPDWLGEVDLSPTEAHARMGTRALGEAQWLTYDHLADAEIALRRRLLREQRRHVFACTPPAEAAAREVGDLVDGWLLEHGPAGRPEPDAGDGHPLARAGARVQEDLCLMVRRQGSWHLDGAVLCFPSLWLLSEKLGRPTVEVHAPVPYYADELSQRVDTLFDRLRPGKMVWRRNVSVWPALLLWAPCHELDPSLHAAAVEGGAPPLWIRSERQTLRRLPDSGAILFTIRVQTAAVAVLAGHPGRAGDLAAWFRAPIGEVRRQQLGGHLDTLLPWLDAVARTGTGKTG
jgi:hypothetical protein